MVYHSTQKSAQAPRASQAIDFFSQEKITGHLPDSPLRSVRFTLSVALRYHFAMGTSRVAETGLTVLYEPQDKASEVDIVFIHGLQGHPELTWLWRGIDPSTASQKHKRTPTSLLHLPKLFKNISKPKTNDSIPSDRTHSATRTRTSSSTYQHSKNETY